MNTIALLCTFYDKALQHCDSKAPGMIFEYRDPALIGLMTAAEIMARVKRRGLASMFIPTCRVTNLITLPTTRFKHNFDLGNKLDRLYEDNYYLLCVQHDIQLDGGNCLILKIRVDDSKVILYSFKKNKDQITLTTEMDFIFGKVTEEDIQRFYKLVIGELSYMKEHSDFMPFQ